jgi:hypothetical protein
MENKSPFFDDVGSGWVALHRDREQHPRTKRQSEMVVIGRNILME